MVRLQNVGEVQETEAEAMPTTDTTEPTADTVEANEVAPESNGNEEVVADTGSNLEVRRKHFSRLVGQIGGEYGTGKKALITLARVVVEGAQTQALKASTNVATPKGAKKKLDDAAALYGRFRAGADKKAGAIVDAELAAGANDGSWKTQVSKLRTLIKFGNEYRDDATEIVETAIGVHTGLLGSPADRKALKLTSTYSALVLVAREQMKDEHKGQPMTEDELRTLFLTEEKAAPTGANLIENAIKTLRRAQKGKDETEEVQGRDAVTDPGVEDAIQALRDVISRVAPERWAEIVDEEARKAGEAADKAMSAEETEELEAE
jgi:hypothetical protein